MNESQIFKAVVGLPVEKRAEYLDLACGGDRQLRNDVESLLKAHDQGASFLEKPAVAEDLDATAEHRPIAEGPGSVIGPYRLMEVVGEGGFGLVFVAEQQEPIRRKVALKIIKPGMDTKEIIARFEAERQALALMNHPHVAKVLDAGTTDSGRPFFVMELIRGVPIVDYCDAQELTTRERLELFVTVCSAVQHAHTKGIIHRDLKPSNILVSPHDGIPVVKIIDFGIAKALGQRLTDKTVYTRLTQMIGTPLYMSPEQAEINALDVDIRSDVYSLGVVLYELLTGTTPFDKDRFSQAAYEEIKRIIREEEPLTPSKRLSTLGDALMTISKTRKTEPTRLAASLKGELDWIAMCCLEKDRSRRYQTAVELAADVERYLADEPVAVVPPSVLYKAKKITRRHKIPIVIAGSFLLLLFVFAILQVRTSMSLQATLESLRSELLDRAFNESFNSVDGEIRPALKAIENARLTGASEEITETLKAIAYFNAGQTQEAVDRLRRLEADTDNDLAMIALVWMPYDSGEFPDIQRMHEKLRELQRRQAGFQESDFETLLLARATTYAPGKADERAIRNLTDVIDRHRLWGYAYFSRAEAYRDKFSRTKKISDLQSAFEDDEMARVLLPHSETVKTYSLILHLHAWMYARANPNFVDPSSSERWRKAAEDLASRFASSLSSFNGAASALAYYRATEQVAIADALERDIEEKFADLQTIRDFGLFDTRNYRQLRRHAEENVFTKHLYALTLFEKGDCETARDLIEETVRGPRDADEISSAMEMLQLMQEFDRCTALGKSYLESENYRCLYGWCRIAVEYHAGAGDETDQRSFIERAAPFPEQSCYAHYCVGITNLARGDRKLAKEHFKAAVETGRIGWGAFSRSKAFLRRMEKNPQWPEWIPQGRNEESES